jgi:SagB-type dehydrogenase family enzyme
MLFRAAPSAGALSPTELYAVCGPLADPPGCTTSRRPSSLRRLRDGDFRARLAVAAAPAVARLPLCLVLTGIPWRTSWKYRERGYRHLFWGAGAIVANLLAVAAAAGWDVRVLVGFVDQEVSALLGLGQPAEYPLGLVTVAAPAAAAATGSPPLEPSTHGPGRCPAPRGAIPWGPPPSTLVTLLARRRSAPGAGRPAGSGPSLRPGPSQRARPARRALPPTRSRR